MYMFLLASSCLGESVEKTVWFISSARLIFIFPLLPRLPLPLPLPIQFLLLLHRSLPRTIRI